SSIGFDDCYTWIHQTYTATDDCGNSTTVVRNINIIDTTAPVLEEAPADATVECSDIPAAAVLNATDNCDEEVEVGYNEAFVPVDECSYQLVRTWVAIDECGNTDTESQTLTVTDTTAPVLTGEDSELTLECNIAPSIIAPTATDNCDEDVTIVPSSETFPGVCENAWTTVHTFTAYDNCGNSAVRIYTFHFQDTTDPTFDNMPENMTVECDEIPEPEEVTASDNCDDEVEVEYTQSSTDGCPYTITRTWVATDNCENTSIYSQVITVIDETAPVITTELENSTIQCGEIPAPAVVEATDNCDDDVTVTHNDVVTSDGCPYTVVRTYTATDNCGNTDTASQTFIVNDTTDPYVVEGVPSELTIECDEDEPFYLPEFGDNCDEDLDVNAISGLGNVTPCGYDILRSWTATDNCNNSITVSQVIHVVDTTDPYFTNVPEEEITVECDEIPAPYNVEAADNCHEPAVTFSQTMTEGCPYTITRTWVANDGCGNSSIFVQTINVVDETAPVVINNPPVAFDIECGEEMPEFNPVFDDNCDENLDITYNEEEVSGNCPGGLLRTWTATDNCGNSTEFIQIIFIHDTTAPVLSGEDTEFTLECNVSPTLIAPTATDACDEDVAITFDSEEIPGECANEWTVIYTWTATDFCENQSQRHVTIHFEDTTAPVLSSYPVDATYECTEIPAADVLTAEDNCDDEVAVIFIESTEDVTCGYIITRTWSATDDCGNSVSHEQTITVIDVTDPTVEEGVPAELTIECNTEVPDYTPVFDDNCDNDLTLTSNEVETNITACGYDIERSWTATDDCGNSTSVYQTIHVVDSIDPILVGVPASTEAECDNIPSVPLVTGDDNCDDNVQVSFSQSATDGCPYVITRTWIATDDCGNTSTASQTITVIDTTDPIVVEGVPAELTIECDEDEPFYLPTFDDNCDDDLDVTAASGINNVTDCGYDIERVWTATDNCDNSVSVTQIIHVLDTTNPVLTGEDFELTLECNVAPSIIAPTATDNCDEDVTIVPSTETFPGECENSWTEVITFTAYDNCGNSAVRTYTFHFQDTTEPTFDEVTDDASYECIDEVPAAPALTASDNCDDEVEVVLESNTEQLGCGYLITRIWTATDNCDNSTTHTQYIYVFDETAPELFGVPADVTIECGTEIPAPAETWASDNCEGFITLEYNDVILPQDCFYQIKRYYTATDACGNQTAIPQIITVTDSTDPMIEAPIDITVNCDEVPEPAVVEATDNCDQDVTVTYNEEIGEGCPYSIIRTWTATDDCGNTSSATQMVYVIDEEAPVFDAFPPFITIECDEIATYTVTAQDNCSEAVVVEIIQEFPVSGDCFGGLLRVYQATDLCGNVTISSTQIIDIVDSTAPTLIGVPADITIECGDELPAVPAVTADDNCDDDLTVQYTQTQTNQFCPYDIIRQWSTIDDCGNVTVEQQVIHVTVQVPQQALLSAFPNPADQHFTVKFSTPVDMQVKAAIYDVTGREITAIFNGIADGGRQYEWQIDARTFRAGAYVIAIQSDNEVLRQQMIVNGGK
ncbi:MAG: T9SS type A sorting domain-containing protein, partial [Flavobacteriales bacterium]